MNEWLKTHAWPVVIALCGIGSTFILYGYRIDNLEKQVQDNQSAIATLNNQQVGIQVQLAQISTDIQYIKQALDRLDNQK